MGGGWAGARVGFRTSFPPAYFPEQEVQESSRAGPEKVGTLLNRITLGPDGGRVGRSRDG